MSDQETQDARATEDTLTPEEYEVWKTDRSQVAHEAVEKLLDIDHTGGTWDVDVHPPGDISLKMWILIIVIVIAVVLIIYRDLIYAILL